MSSTKHTNPPVAVITGAAQGIGRAIAIRLASEGYLLALGDLMSNQNQLQLVVDECIEAQRSVMSNRGITPRVLPVVCDVSNESQVEALVQAAVTELNGIDVMVANAGIYKGIPFLETTDQMLDDLYAVNVKGVLYSYRAAARAMIPRGGGRIVGACSAAGKSGFPLEGAYCASKFAVRGLTQTAAREWAQHGITVNTYAPGPTDTDMWNKVVMREAPDRAEVFSKMATGRITSPEDIAGLVSFLVSPAAKNITGKSFDRHVLEECIRDLRHQARAYRSTEA